MCYGYITELSVLFCNGLNTVEFAVLFFAFQKIEHAFNEVVDVEEFELCGTVVYGEFLIVCDSPAECGHCGIILRS